MLNKAKLSQILRRAGFEASKQTTTAVRGWYNFSRGYDVELINENGTCRVSQRSNSNSELSYQTAREAVALYASALLALGFNVHFAHAEDDARYGHVLVVSEYATEA
jgi:hypothetical protein